MVDAADEPKMDAAKQELLSLLEKPQLAGIPVLVLGNKCDLPGAFAAEQLVEALYVQVSPWPRLWCPRGMPAHHALVTRGRELKGIGDREVCCYSISCKNQINIGRGFSVSMARPPNATACRMADWPVSPAEITLKWLMQHAKKS
jgi:ADP-ribosylation factor-like protein 8